MSRNDILPSIKSLQMEKQSEAVIIMSLIPDPTVRRQLAVYSTKPSILNRVSSPHIHKLDPTRMPRIIVPVQKIW